MFPLQLLHFGAERDAIASGYRNPPIRLSENMLNRTAGRTWFQKIDGRPFTDLRMPSLRSGTSQA